MSIDRSRRLATIYAVKNTWKNYPSKKEEKAEKIVPKMVYKNVDKLESDMKYLRSKIDYLEGKVRHLEERNLIADRTIDFWKKEHLNMSVLKPIQYIVPEGTILTKEGELKCK